MTRVSVHEYATAVRDRYRAAPKAEKGRILDGFCQATGRHRKAAIRLLRRLTGAGQGRRGHPRRYGPLVQQACLSVGRRWSGCGS